MQRVLFCAGLIGSVFVGQAQAQVTPDGTLNTTVTSSGNVFTITNGTVRGSNLFHSFGQFSIPTNGAANFELGNTPGISTIFGRVTGGSPSSIDGTIRTLLNNTPTIAPVDLFLLNPSGILFGANARLALSGSLIGTTANRIQFENGVEFPATAIEPPLLVQTAPIGLQFGASPGAIVNRSPDLSVRPQQTFALIGGDVSLEGGRISAPGGRVELGSATPTATPEIVRLDRSNGTVRFNFAAAPSQGTVLLNNSRVNVSATRAGDIAIHGRNVNLSDASQLTTDITGAGSLTDRSGNIVMNALETIHIDKSLVSSEITESSIGNLGDITLNGRSVSITTGGQIMSQTRSQGNAGNITISARDTVTLAGQNGMTFSDIQNRVGSTGIGNAGDITITAGAFEMLNGPMIVTNTEGRGNAGNITFKIRENFTIRGLDQGGYGAVIQATILSNGVGNGGSVNITARSMNHEDGAQIFTGISEFAQGNGADLTITLQDGLLLRGRDVRGEGSLFAATVLQDGTGNAGAIQITARTFEAIDGGFISADTQGNGNAGNITLNVSERVTLSGFDQQTGEGHRSSRITSNAGSLTDTERTAKTTGIGGRITLNTDTLFLSDGAMIRSGVSNQGEGGMIIVNANTLNLTSGGQISSTTLGVGRSGDLHLKVRDRITISGSRSILEGSTELADPVATGSEIRSGIYANATRRSHQPMELKITGQAGSVEIAANRVELLDRAQINVSNLESGNAGNLTIKADSLQLDSGATLSANVLSGEQGNIAIASRDLWMQNGSSITTNTSGSGNAGQINLTASRATLADSQISSQSTGSGNAGTLSVAAQTVKLDRASKLTTESTHAGQAGNVLVRADQVALRNNSEMTSRSSGTGNGGTIDIRANRLSLSDGSVLNAQTAAGDGGNILLTLTNLLTLNSQSLLSAAAGGTGNGGNIHIQADYILGSGNSDIIANAFQGRGGNIRITTQGIFGLQFRDVLDPRATFTNDITASSQFSVNGTVQIALLSVDPNAGLVELPNLLVDPSQQIGQGCQATQGSSFIVTGRGGIPSNPLDEVGRTPAVWSDLRPYASSQQAAAPQPAVVPLVEASSWQRNPDGKVELMAARSTQWDAATCVPTP